MAVLGVFKLVKGGSNLFFNRSESDVAVICLFKWVKYLCNLIISVSQMLLATASSGWPQMNMPWEGSQYFTALVCYCTYLVSRALVVPW